MQMQLTAPVRADGNFNGLAHRKGRYDERWPTNKRSRGLLPVTSSSRSRGRQTNAASAGGYRHYPRYSGTRRSFSRSRVSLPRKGHRVLRRSFMTMPLIIGTGVLAPGLDFVWLAVGQYLLQLRLLKRRPCDFDVSPCRPPCQQSRPGRAPLRYVLCWSRAAVAPLAVPPTAEMK